MIHLRRFLRPSGLGVVALSLFAALAVACAPAPAPQPAAPAKPAPEVPKAPAAAPKVTGPVKIALHVAVTGPAAILGGSARNGFNMAVEEINAKGGIGGQKIEVLFEDAGADNTSAINSFKKLAGDKPVAMIGPIASAQMMAMMQTIKETKIPYLFASTSPTVTEQGNPYLFRITSHDGFRTKASTDYTIEKLGKTKLGLIHTNDEYGNTAAQIIKDRVKEKYSQKATIVTDQAFAGTDKDLTGQLISIRNAGADIIMINGFPAQSALAVKQRKQLGMDNIPVMGDNNGTSPAFLGVLTEDEAVTIYSAAAAVPIVSEDPKVQEWVKKYRDKFNAAPDNYSLNYYDGVYMLKSVIEKVGTDPEALRKGLSEVKDFPGVMFKYTCDKNGDCVHAAYIALADRKKITILQPITEEGF